MHLVAAIVLAAVGISIRAMASSPGWLNDYGVALFTFCSGARWPGDLASREYGSSCDMGIRRDVRERGAAALASGVARERPLHDPWFDVAWDRVRSARLSSLRDWGWTRNDAATIARTFIRGLRWNIDRWERAE